jgi:hypothetical protein
MHPRRATDVLSFDFFMDTLFARNPCLVTRKTGGKQIIPVKVK